LLTVILLLMGCAKPQAATLPASVPETATTLPTATSVPPTMTPIPMPVQDPANFGSIGVGEIQAFALESVANAIFKKTFDGLVADGNIQEYQVTSITVFPGNGGLLSEIIFNIRTADPAWLDGGGTEGPDGWIVTNCYRFDLVTTETEHQLKNKRLCG
jgi:hypothetical protein